MIFLQIAIAYRVSRLLVLLHLHIILFNMLVQRLVYAQMKQ